jgi:hypothetical protein
LLHDFPAGKRRRPRGEAAGVANETRRRARRHRGETGPVQDRARAQTGIPPAEPFEREDIMLRKSAIAVLAATLAVAHVGGASAIIVMNGTGDNGVRHNGGGENGQGSQGVSPNGAASVSVVGIELPVPVAR